MWHDAQKQEGLVHPKQNLMWLVLAAQSTLVA